MRKISSLISLCACLYLSPVHSQDHSLVKRWETDSTLKVPESVCLDQNNKLLYVSNIEGTQPWEKDGMGSIGKIGLDGKILKVDWVTGLNAPKGMGLFKKYLYVADIDQVVVIDTKSGKIIRRISIPGALALNDITVDAKGIVYVSDSRGKKIYVIDQNHVDTFLDNLKGPNGILVSDSNLYVLDNGGLYFMWPNKTPRVIAEGMEEGTDGLQMANKNEYIVSNWSGMIWYIDKSGNKQLLLDTREGKINSADICYDATTKTLYVPTFWKNSVVAYDLK